MRGWPCATTRSKSACRRAASSSRIDAAELRRYEGAYRNEMLGGARVSLEGGHLALTFEPGSAIDLRPAAHGDFTGCFRGHEQWPTPIRFVHDLRGSVTGLVLGGEGPEARFEELRFSRVEE